MARAGAGLGVVLALCVATPASAQVWQGGTSDDWTDGSNWSTGTAPASNATVTINSSSPNAPVLGKSSGVAAPVGTLQVGMVAGTSAFTIQNGSTLAVSGALANYIGNAAGGNATVTVTGPGSSLSFTGIANVGNMGTGTLNISNGARVSATNALGLAFGNSAGSGVLNITGGGTLITTSASVRNGIATVSGPGSLWDTGTLSVGAINNLNGALNVQSGAIVKLSGSLAVGGQNLSNRNGVGTVAISGAGSQLSTGGALNIGLWGQGGVTVADGAVATANSVTMATAALGNATLNVANNGTLATGALTAGAGTAQVNFDGATLRATAANPAFVSGFEGTGLNIAGGGLTLDTGAFNVTGASPFSGTGALTKTGRGAAVLTGDNVYAGGTTILDGTVQLGNGGTSGSIVGDINNNGTLAFQRADSYTFGGRIAGHGSVEQSGTGTTILTADNSYTGGTVVRAGTVQVDRDANLGSLDGRLTLDGGALRNTSAFASARAITLESNGGTFDTEADLMMTGTVEGAGALTKTAGGTLVLAGTNTYTGGTTISGGTLQIGNGGSSASLPGNVVVNGGATLAFNRSDRYTYGGVVSGAGGLAQNGTGTTVLTAAHTYTGPTNVNLGTLSIDGSITSPVTVSGTGTLSGSGTIFGDVTNTGTVTPGGTGVLTVAGNYIGNGGTVRVNTVFGGDASATGRLVVTGDTSGTSQVRVVNVGGAGALTSEGIKVIDVQGASNGTFTLAGDYTFQGQPAVVAGAYGYRLFKNAVSTPDDGGWYLRSSLLDPAVVGAPAAAAAGPLLAPTVPVYEAYSSVLQRFNELGTLQQRVGNRSWSSNASVQAEQEAGKPIIGRGAWARVEGSNTHIDPSTSTTSASYNVRMWKFEGGVDAPVIQNQSGTLVVGPTFHYGIANANVSSMFGNGAIDATGYGFGGTATWYGNNGSYVDARATLTWYDTDLRSSTLGTKLANGNRGSGVATSVEAGHQLALGGNWSITPQAQLAWSQVRFDAFTDQYGANVSRDNGNSLVSRLGVSIDHETKWTGANGKTRRSHVYGITNLYHDFLHGTSARVADISVVSKEQALWAGLGIGASMNWNDDRYAVYGELLARTSVQNFGDSNAIGAKLGLRVKW